MSILYRNMMYDAHPTDTTPNQVAIISITAQKQLLLRNRWCLESPLPGAHCQLTREHRQQPSLTFPFGQFRMTTGWFKLCE